MGKPPHITDMESGEEQESIFNNLLDTTVYKKSMKNARVWLYIVSTLQFLMGIYEYFSAFDNTIGIASFTLDTIIAVFFLSLALWSKKRPVAAFTLALIFYLLFIIGMVILDSQNIFRGFIIKILVVIALIKANRDARQYEAYRSSLSEHS